MTGEHDNVTQALPMPGAGPQMRMVEVDLIEESLTNPRRRFNQIKQQEIADSIASSGVLTPVLLRPLPGHRVPETWGFRRQGSPLPVYELVAGARRLRGTKMNKLTEIPALIREMTDAQVREFQLVENLQREDISKLEEAEGYRALMDETGMTADEVGAKVGMGKGKSRTYIYNVLKILDLCERGRELLAENKIEWSVALVIARIPGKTLQHKALDEIERHIGWEQPYTARQAQSMVQREYMLQLEHAPFDRDDASLCADAGACSSCPHRTGANPEIYEDVDSADVCTNPPCYRQKEDAHAVSVRKKAEEMGCEVIDGRQAKELMPSPYGSEVKNYLRLDNPSDSPVKGKTLRKLVHKALDTTGIKPTMVVNPYDKNELIPVVTPEQAQELLKVAGKAEAHEKLQKDIEEDKKADAATAKKQAVTDFETGWRKEVARLVAVHAKEPSDAALLASARLVTLHLVGTLNGDHAKELCKMLDLGKVAPKDAIRDLAGEWAHPVALAGAILALRDKDYSPWYYEHYPDRPRNPELIAMAEACGIDVEGVKAKVKANMRAVAAEKEAAAKKPEAPEGDLPLQPAARAGGGAARSKNGAGKGSAAGANEVPKTSAAHASAQIAEALQGLEESGAAAAAQGLDGVPVADAQAPTTGADALGHEAAPVDAVASQDLPPSSTVAADDRAEDDAEQQPAAAPSQQGRGFAIDTVVRVKDGLRGPNNKLRKTCGRVGVVKQGLPGGGIPVMFGPRAHESAIFTADELEPYKADPIVGKRARVLKAGMTERRNAFMWKEGTVSGVLEDGWQITFHSKTGGLPTQEVFGTDELESIE